MRVLLDTHAFLAWVSAGGARLSTRARELVSDEATEALVSAVSAAEISTKVANGRLVLPGPAERYVPSRIARHGFMVLPLDLRHALRVGSLPDIHRDPWDRLLVAQAQLEGLPIITADPLIGRYDVETIW